MDQEQTQENLLPPSELKEVPEVVEESSTTPPLKSTLIGALLLTVSITGGIFLITEFLPNAALETPTAQAAAAAVEINSPFDDLALSARAVYVYDARDDKKIFAEGSATQLPLASITKVALVLAAAEVLPLDSTVTISRTAVERGGGGLTWGEEWRVRDLIDYTLITSSNTGAEALREAADPLLALKYPEGTQTNATVWRMNALAHQLDMRETYFLNATGLDESTTQAGALSSAHDVSTLVQYALRTHRDLFASTAKSETWLGPINAPERVAVNTNDALHTIPGIVMGKTGFTDLAGGNLVVVVNVAPDHPVIIVALGSTVTGRFTDVQALAEAVRTSFSAK